MSKWTQDNSMPCRAERQKIREHAEQILARARLLRERLDQSGGVLVLSLPSEALADRVAHLDFLQAARVHNP